MQSRISTNLMRLIIVCPAASTASAQSFTGLGFPPGAFRTEAMGVNGTGEVVVGYASGGGEPAFLWTHDGGNVALPWSGYAFGVSGDGQIVVGRRFDGTGEAVRWTESAGVQNLGFLTPGDTDSSATGVSANGSVIIGYSGVLGGTFDREAFRWTPSAGMEGLGLLQGHTHSHARGVSADGAVIVGSSYTWRPGGGYPQEAFRWTQTGGMQGIGFLPGDDASAAAAVSADGSTIVGGSYLVGGFGSHPFRWTQAGGMQPLGPGPGGSDCDALSVSGDGSLIVGTCYTPTGVVAMIWTPELGIRSLEQALVNEYGLQLPGWRLAVAHAVTADGRAIVGVGRNPGGSEEAFLAILSPACDPCDANCDGVVDAFDIEPFITRLLGGGGCNACTGDVNGDGAIDAFDIEPFVDCLVQP